MTLYYKRDGTPYPEGNEGLAQLENDLWNDNYKVVKRTNLPGGKWISTVWLGIDHNHGRGRPLIFESMVFPRDGFNSLDMDRYSTEAEALAGHKKLVKKWGGKKP